MQDIESNMLNIHTVDSYTNYLKSLNLGNYNDYFDNQDDYEKAWLFAVKEENATCREIIQRFYNKAFMIKENVAQIYKTLPAATFLLNHSPFYLNILLDFLIDNLRAKRKEAGLLACLNNFHTYSYHYELEVIVDLLDFNKIMTYYHNDSIMLKKIFQIFALMPDPTNLLQYETTIKTISLTFYSFALSISFKINEIEEIHSRYDSIISSVKNNVLKSITDSFCKISNNEIKEKLKDTIVNVWTQIASLRMYWLFPQESMGYWALIGYLDNWREEDDLAFLNEIVSTSYMSFAEEDKLFSRRYDKSIPEQLKYYESLIYSEHKISQIKGCLEYYRANDKKLINVASC